MHLIIKIILEEQFYMNGIYIVLDLVK